MDLNCCFNNHPRDCYFDCLEDPIIPERVFKSLLDRLEEAGDEESLAAADHLLKCGTDALKAPAKSEYFRLTKKGLVPTATAEEIGRIISSATDIEALDRIANIRGTPRRAVIRAFDSMQGVGWLVQTAADAGSAHDVCGYIRETYEAMDIHLQDKTKLLLPFDARFPATSALPPPAGVGLRTPRFRTTIALYDSLVAELNRLFEAGTLTVNIARGYFERQAKEVMRGILDPNQPPLPM